MLGALLLMASALGTQECPKPKAVSPSVIQEVTGKPIPVRSARLTAITDGDLGPSHAMVFVKSGAQWFAYELEWDNEFVDQSVTPNGGYLVFGFHSAGGPGSSFDGLLFNMENKLVACPTVSFPDTLNRDETDGSRSWSNEYLTFDKLHLQANGVGSIFASGEIDVSGTPRTVQFRYDTRDGGATWSEAIAVDK